MGFFIGFCIGYPLAFILLYQVAPTEVWPFYVSIACAFVLGVFLAWINRSKFMGHLVIGFCGGGIVGYLLYCLIVVGFRETGVTEIGGIAIEDWYVSGFWLVALMTAAIFTFRAISAHRGFFCFCTSVMGAFLFVGGIGFFITTRHDSTLAFPDVVSTFCECLSTQSECERAKYGCIWAPPKNIANLAVNTPSCHRSTVASLANMDFADGMFLVVVVLICALSWPFQYYVTADLYGGSEVSLNLTPITFMTLTLILIIITLL